MEWKDFVGVFFCSHNDSSVRVSLFLFLPNWSILKCSFMLMPSEQVHREPWTSEDTGKHYVFNPALAVSATNLVQLEHQGAASHLPSNAPQPVTSAQPGEDEH